MFFIFIFRSFLLVCTLFPVIFSRTLDCSTEDCDQPEIYSFLGSGCSLVFISSFHSIFTRFTPKFM
jgi:hypothetical protein